MTDPKAAEYVSRTLSRVEHMPFQLALSTALIATFMAVSSIAEIAQRRGGGPVDYDITHSIGSAPIRQFKGGCSRPESAAVCSSGREDFLARTFTAPGKDSLRVGASSCSANWQ